MRAEEVCGLLLIVRLRIYRRNYRFLMMYLLMEYSANIAPLTTTRMLYSDKIHAIGI